MAEITVAGASNPIDSARKKELLIQKELAHFYEEISKFSTELPDRPILSSPSSDLTPLVAHSNDSSNLKMPAVTTVNKNNDSNNIKCISANLLLHEELPTFHQYSSKDTGQNFEYEQQESWNLIGKKIVSPNDALYIVLSWNPEWISEKILNTIPPICGRSDFSLRYMKVKYDYLLNYFKDIFPLLLHDVFFRVREMFKEVYKLKQAQWFELEVISIKLTNTMWELETKLPFSQESPYIFPEQLALVKFVSETGEQKYMLTYISSQKLCARKDQKYVYLKVPQLTNDIEKYKIKLMGFYLLSIFLNEIKAITYLKDLSLKDIILNPCRPQCSMIQLDKLGPFQLAWGGIIKDDVEKMKANLSLEFPDEPRILIIQSPAGTDLISTLIAFVHDIKQFEHIKGKHRVLYCARSFRRFEEVCLRFLTSTGNDATSSKIKVLVLGKIQHSALKKSTVDYQIQKFLEKKNSKSSFQISLEGEHTEAQKFVFESADIIITSIIHCYNESLVSVLGDSFFSICIIDEAYTCTEPETFLPLQYRANKLILAGDPSAKPRTVAPITLNMNTYYCSLAQRINKAIGSFNHICSQSQVF